MVSSGCPPLALLHCSTTHFERLERKRPNCTNGFTAERNFQYSIQEWSSRYHAICRRKTTRSEEHTSELQSRRDLVCRLLLEKKKKYTQWTIQCNIDSSQSLINA